MKDVSKQEFEKSFERHYTMYLKERPSNQSSRLLLFYAVECGLKSLIMQDEHVFMFSKLSKDARECKHDIKKLLKLLDVEQKYQLEELTTSHGDNITCGHYNEFWRYGMLCTQKDKYKEKTIEEELNRIADWIKENK